MGLLVFLYLISIPSFVVNVSGVFDLNMANPLHGLWSWGVPLFVVPYSIPFIYFLLGFAVLSFVTAFKEPKSPF